VKLVKDTTYPETGDTTVVPIKGHSVSTTAPGTHTSQPVRLPKPISPLHGNSTKLPLTSILTTATVRGDAAGRRWRRFLQRIGYYNKVDRKPW
jgi:hypothetical protein